MTDAIKDTYENLRKTITENSIINNKAIENLNERILELKDDECLIAPYFASAQVYLFKPENKRQFRFKKDPNSTKMSYFFDKRRYTSHSI